VAVGSIGANTGVKSREQIEEFMASHRQRGVWREAGYPSVSCLL